MKTTAIILVILTLGLTASSIYYWDSNQDSKQEIVTLSNTIDKLNQALEDVENVKANDIAKAKMTYDSLLEDLRNEIQLGQVKIKQAESKLSVSIIEKVLFPSGKAEISEEGKLILGRVGSILKNTQGKLIRVEGHTDNVQIHPKLQKTYATNWDLSSARASSVVRYLDLKVNIPGKRLRAVGMGPYHPVAQNTTAEGRQWNRRVEIALSPDPAYKAK